MTSFVHSQLAQSLLIPLSLRLADLRDWCERVPLPEKWSIATRIYHDTDKPYVELNVSFGSRAEAEAWAAQYTQFHDNPKKGYAGRQAFGDYLVIHMTDFVIWISFPAVKMNTPEPAVSLPPEPSNLEPATA